MAGSPIIEFYVQYYMWDNEVVSTETKFQEVPFTGDPVISEPKVKNEMGKAGSFEFKMERTSPYYNALLQMKTLMRVTYFGETIFRGRVLTIDKTMYGARTVHCEGDFAFLLDSHQIGTKEDTRSSITVNQYLQNIITQHNSDMNGNPEKQFVLGEVPGNYTNATAASQRVSIPSAKAKQKFGDTSWNTSMDRLEGLLSNFGGYFRTRFVKGVNGASDVTYLDWYDKYYNASVNTQTVEVTKNLIDISGPTEVDNLFTVVIPIGKDNTGKNIYIGDYWPVVKKSHSKSKHIYVSELASIPLYSDAELNSDFHRKEDYLNATTRFGKIWKTVDFENANTPEKLFAYAKDWIKNNFMPELTQWSVSALDMKIVDSENQVLLCGDRVVLVHPEVDSTRNEMTIISVDYDLYNPDKNKYTIGFPSQQINAAYGVKAKDTKTNKVSSKSGKGSGITASPSPVSNPPNDGSDNIEKVQKNIRQQYIQKTELGEDILLDNPSAFLTYNHDGTEKDKKSAISSIADFTKAIDKTKKTKKAEIILEAARRGVSVDDPQLLIDLTPSLKQKQTQWKATTATKLINDYHVPADEAEIVLNETAGQSGLASLVDDDGNWTDYAIQKGATLWDPQMKETAIRVRGILNGTEKTQNSGFLSGAQDAVVGLFQNIGNWNVVDSDALTFDVGDDLINAAEGALNKGVNLLGGVFSGLKGTNGNTSFNLESDGAQVDGNNGSIGLGKHGTLSGWDIALNKQITYTANGVTYTVPAHALAADDMHFTAKYDSLRANLAVVDTLVADYAQIGTLVALNAQVQSLEADTIKTNNLESHISNIDVLNVMALHSSGNVYTDYGFIMAPYIYLGTSGNAKPVANALINLQVVSAGGNNYKIQKMDFDDANWEDIPNTTFSRAISSWTWGGGNGKINVKALPQNQTKSVNISVSGPTSITSNGSYTYTAEYENSDGDDVSTGATRSVTVNVSSSASYSVSYDSAGTFSSSADPNNVLNGWNPQQISGVASSQSQTYRYIKFKVDGKQRSFYFA